MDKELLYNNYNNLQIIESIELSEHEEGNKFLKGLVLFKDSNGKIIDIRDNLILMETRIHLLRTLFEYKKIGDTTEINNFNDDIDRKLCLFKVGSGGADVNGSPFTPYVPQFNDIDLAQPVPFKIVNINKDAVFEDRSNPSVVKTLSDTDKKKYFLKKTYEDGTSKYFGKKPEITSKGWLIDNSTGKVAYSLNLLIDVNDCRGFMINELGLVLAKEIFTNNKVTSHTRVTLGSRVTFDTKSLSDLSTNFEIEYIVYI